MKDNLRPLDRHHWGRRVAKGMGWTAFQTNGGTGEKEVVGGTEKVRWVWGTGAKQESVTTAREKVQEWIRGRPAKEFRAVNLC